MHVKKRGFTVLSKLNSLTVILVITHKPYYISVFTIIIIEQGVLKSDLQAILCTYKHIELTTLSFRIFI